MAVQKLRRETDRRHAIETAPVVEIERPLPLRARDPSSSGSTAEAKAAAEFVAKPVRRRKSFGARLRGFAVGLTGLGLVAAYPVAIAMASDVGDRAASASPAVAGERQAWASPWAQASAELLHRQIDDFGWAKSASTWSPMARLVAKPAYQQALAEAVGQSARLVATEVSGAGAPVAPSLLAVGRLLSASSTEAQVRAAHVALINFDREQRHNGSAPAVSATAAKNRIALVQGWAAQDRQTLAALAAKPQALLLDPAAAAAIYAVKARASVAAAMLQQLPVEAAVAADRAAAVAAWRAVAEFHPLMIANGPADSLVGSHPAAVAFMLAEAQDRAQTLQRRIGGEASVAPAGSAGAAAAAGVNAG